MDNKQENSWQFDPQLWAAAEQKLADAALTGKFGIVPDADELLGDLEGRLHHELEVHQIELQMQNEELRRTQTALEASRDRYLQLYEFAPVGYLTLTGDGLIMEANLTSATLLGVERKKMLKRRFASYIAPKDSDRWYRFVLQTKEGCNKNLELTLHRADGTCFDALLSCQCGTAQIRRITLTDISERKQAETELRIAAAAFESQDGIIVTDDHKTILRVNQAFFRITGFSAQEAVGRTPFFLRSGVHDQDFYQAIGTSLVLDGYWKGEIWDKRKNGEIFPAWLTITAIFDENRCLTHYVGSFTEITALKQAEKVLLKARKRLERQVASTREELENIKENSSEISTALSVVLKYRETDKSDAQRAFSQEMEQTILPFMKKLKNADTDDGQKLLIHILESNLQHLMKTYGRATSLPALYSQLTPTEAQVASMIRQGLSTKLIASTLNLAQGTIGIHRKHIRKKLGLDNTATNLVSYLLSMTE
ncbi:MAG: PAS domain S-box protein [Methylovulum sp.]|nr:PAS domain S-box protein [Methylovulum sp.]